MFKKVLIFAAILTAVIAVNSSVVSAKKPVVVEDNNKVTICHGTTSVTNPYTRPTVDADAADGNTGNDNGQGDHSTHTGPVATSPAVAQGLKNAKVAWGDIIPPHHNYPGLNWTAAGQEIYNNNCEYVEPNFDIALLSYDVTCPEDGVGNVVLTLYNAGQAAGTATVNGQVVNVPAGLSVVLEFAQGQSIETIIDRQTVYDQTPICMGDDDDDDDNPETPPVTTTTGGMGAGGSAVSVAQVDAPASGVGAGGGSFLTPVAVLITSITSIAYGVLRLRKTSL